MNNTVRKNDEISILSTDNKIQYRSNRLAPHPHPLPITPLKHVHLPENRRSRFTYCCLPARTRIINVPLPSIILCWIIQVVSIYNVYAYLLTYTGSQYWISTICTRNILLSNVKPLSFFIIYNLLKRYLQETIFFT